MPVYLVRELVRDEARVGGRAGVDDAERRFAGTDREQAGGHLEPAVAEDLDGAAHHAVGADLPPPPEGQIDQRARGGDGAVDVAGNQPELAFEVQVVPQHLGEGAARRPRRLVRCQGQAVGDGDARLGPDAVPDGHPDRVLLHRLRGGLHEHRQRGSGQHRQRGRRDAPTPGGMRVRSAALAGPLRAAGLRAIGGAARNTGHRRMLLSVCSENPDERSGGRRGTPAAGTATVSSAARRARRWYRGRSDRCWPPAPRR